MIIITNNTLIITNRPIAAVIADQTFAKKGELLQESYISH